MPIAVGQRFVRRHNAARASTANGTAADITYDTAVLSEGDYTYNGPDVEVDTAGLYLCMFDIGLCDVASTRAVGTLVPRVNGVDQTRFRATHRYLRNSGGSQDGCSFGAAILDLAANDDVRIRNPGALAPTDAVGNYATASGESGGFQLVRLPDGNFTHVEQQTDVAEIGTSNINATRPWVDGSGTWTAISFDTEIQDDDNLHSSGTFTLAANTKYLIIWGVTPYSTDASRHTYVGRLRINATNVQSSSSYQRNTASQGCPLGGMYLHETGGSAETMFIQMTHETEGGDAGTPEVADAYCQILELPSTAEWIHVDNGTTDSMTTALAGTTTWYTMPLSSSFRADADSDLSLDAANDAIQNDSGGSLGLLVFGWQRWDRDAGTSGTRKAPMTRFNNGGSAVQYGNNSAFSRGQQSADDTWQAHITAGVLIDLANGADLTMQTTERASGANSDMGIYASTSRYFLGMQALRLNSLSGSGPTINQRTLSDNITVTDPLDAIMRDRDVTTRDEEVEVGDDVFMLRERYRVLFDAIDAIDNAIATYVSTGGVINNQTLTDSLEVNDDVFMLRQRIRVLADALEAFDSIDYHRVRHQVLSDSLTVTDLQAIMLRLRQRVLTDTVPTYSRPTLHKHTVTITNNVVSLFDSLVATVTSEIINSSTLTDTIELNDFLIALSRLRYRLITDSIDVVDALSISRLRPELLADDLAVTDSIVRYAIRARLITDTVSTADALDALRQRYRNLFDSLEIQDATDVIRYRNRLMAETVQVVDSAIEDRLRQRTLIDEVQLSEAMLALRQRFRVINDSIIVVDNIVVTTGGITVNTRTVQDAIDVSDLTLQIIRYRNRRQTESMIVVDVIDDITTRPRLVTDSIEVSDNAAVLRQFWRRNVDTLDVTDLQLATVSRLRTLFDNVDITDEDTTAKLAFLFDSIDVTDDLIRVVLRQSVLTDAFSVLDSYAKQIVGPTEVTFITHGVESLPIDLGVEVFHIKTGVEQET